MDFQDRPPAGVIFQPELELKVIQPRPPRLDLRQKRQFFAEKKVKKDAA
jgi:hypothetical protein